jgi:hypothetical protein
MLPTAEIRGARSRLGGYGTAMTVPTVPDDDPRVAEHTPAALDKRLRAEAANFDHSWTRLVNAVIAARAAEVHAALGFASWFDYLADVIAANMPNIARSVEQRRQVVALLTFELGMSQRPIGDMLGVSQKTVDRDLDHVSHDDSPDRRVISSDGKNQPGHHHPKPRPDVPAPPAGSPSSIEAIVKALQAADKSPEARSATPIATWNPARQLWETNQPDLFSEQLEPFTKTWPTMFEMRGGRLYPPPAGAIATFREMFPEAPDPRKDVLRVIDDGPPRPKPRPLPDDSRRRLELDKIASRMAHLYGDTVAMHEKAPAWDAYELEQLGCMSRHLAQIQDLLAEMGHPDQA